MSRNAYPGDLNDTEWLILEPLLPVASGRGRVRQVELREIINAILYLLRTGCAWRMLPHDLPPWQTVYGYFRKFQREGVWQQIHDTLRKKVRRKAGKKPTPSAAIIDSQSVKTSEKGDSVGTMRAKRSLAANAISLLIPWV